jgi:hypothetical protein
MRYLYITMRTTALLAFLVPGALDAQEQQGSGSPYMAHGLGDLIGSNQVSQANMGGTGIALMDPISVIHANPASYVGLRMPVFETGLVSRGIRYEREGERTTGSRTDLLGISLGVPVGHGSILEGRAQRASRWGFALGLAPMARVGYSISDQGTEPVSGSNVRYAYSGNGGLNKAFLGVGLVLWQSNDTIEKGSRLAMGANINYLFGSLEEVRRAYYPVASNIYNTNVSNRLTIRAPVPSVGFQFSGDLVREQRVQAALDARRGRAVEGGRSARNRVAEPLRYILGASAELPTAMGAENTRLVNSFAVGASGVEFPFDTVLHLVGERGTVDLPMLIGVGASVYNSRWMVSVEHRRRDWSLFAIQVEGAENRSQLTMQEVYALGASFKPAGNRSGTLLQRTTYRAGMRLVQDYRIVNGQQLQEIGMGFGIGLPVMNNTTRSRINLGVELSERGSLENGLMRERSVNFFLGLTITPDVRESWFKKRRLD